MKIKQIAIPTRLKHLRLVNKQGPLLLLAAFIGILGGIGAIGFHIALEWCTHIVLGTFAGLEPWSESGYLPRPLFFIIPALGGLISGYIVFRFAPETQGHGTDAMINTFHNKGGKVRKRVPFVKAITSILTISSGGSAGYEGPVAQIGSGMASSLTKFFHVSTKYRRILTLAGTAAGLGAIFKAPLGGALTSVEVLYKEDFESDAFLTSIIASVVAYATYCSVTGYNAVLSGLPVYIFDNPIELIGYGLMGVLFAPLSLLYVKTFNFSQKTFKKLPIPPHFKPAVGGLGVGVLFYLCPEILAGGWNYLMDAMRVPNYTLHAAAGLAFLGFMKMIATSLTVGSAGSGGIFGPSLFIGGMFGGAFGTILHAMFPTLILHPGAFVLVGMGAFFSGAANAPIASVIMVCELTGNYNLLPPLMLSSVIHVFLAHKWSIYESQVFNKFHSRAHKYDINTDVLRGVLVSQILKTDTQYVSISTSDTVQSLEKQLAETEEDIFIVEENKKMIGVLDVHDIRKAIFDKSISKLVIVEDLMEKPKFIKPCMDLHTASQVFLRFGVTELPVVQVSNMQILGMLRSNEIMTSYDHCVKK